MAKATASTLTDEITIAIPRDLHAQIADWRERLPSRYGTPTLKAVIADLLRQGLRRAKASS